MAEYAHPQEAPVKPVVASPLSRRFGTKWRLGLAPAAAGVLLLIYGLAAPLIGGIGLWGTDIPHVWGFGIANYAWWIGIANGASLLASILVLRRHNLRTAINRFAEAVAVAAVFAAGLYPIIHLGRPLLAYWMFPYPATTGLWPQFLSPLTWDFWAILAHVFVTTLFWYVGLIPDLALLRDRAKRKWARYFYGVLALGWRGSVAHWALHQRTHRLVAIAVIPMLFVMQSAVAFMFASTIVPGWHSTRLPLQLVVTGFESGLAAMLLVAWLLRRGLSLERHIDDFDMDLLGRLLAANALVAAWLFAGMLYFGLLGEPVARGALLQRLGGDYRALFWTGLVLTVAVPQALWWQKVRHRFSLAVGIAVLALVGIWLERLSLVIAGLNEERIGLLRASYWPTVQEWALLLGTAGLAAGLLLLFARMLPAVSLYETRHDEHLGRSR